MIDADVAAVLEQYETKMDEERRTPVKELAAGEIDERMRAVGPRTGRLIHLLACSLNSPTILELGTSYGYSTIWLGDAARQSGGKLITMELHDYKSAFAQQMAAKAGLSQFIDFRVGDAIEMTRNFEGRIDFVLLDVWKDLYVPCLEAFYPKLNAGAIVVADNMRPERDVIRSYGRAIRSKEGITSIALPVGSWLEVSRYQPDGSPYA
jgi:predicted O-methyltransferase YrrM